MVLVLPSLHNTKYSFSYDSTYCANFVASPKTTGNIPVARGSKIPTIPAFLIDNFFLIILSEWLDEIFLGLSINKRPLSIILFF